MNYFLCLMSSAFIAVSSVFIKEYQKKTGKVKNADYIFNAVISIIAALFYAITGAFSDGLAVSMDFMPYSFLYAVGYVAGSVGYLCAVSRGSLLITVIMSQMGCLIPIVYSLIIYGDDPTPAMVVGMLLLIIALVLFHMQKNQSERTDPMFRLFSFLSFLGNGVAYLAVKIQQHDSPGEYESAMLFYGIVLAAVGFIALVLIKPPKNHGTSVGGCANILVGSAVWAVAYGLCNGAANYLNALVVSRLPTIAFYMCGIGFGILLSFMFARFIYREKLRWYQYSGCLIATVGLILIMAF